MNTKQIVAAVLGLILVGAGMAGIYFKIEGSGWVLAVGLLVIVCEF